MTVYVPAGTVKEAGPTVCDVSVPLALITAIVTFPLPVQESVKSSGPSALTVTV
jgi:hypothetical protein